MKSKPKQEHPIIAGSWLILLVHLDAFRLAPRAYLVALWWRLRRKWLRSRSQFAPLLGRSRWAYRLWMQRHDKVPSLQDAETRKPPIVALIDIGRGQTGLEETLRSTSAEGLTALVIGSCDIPSIRDAASHIDWSGQPWLMPMRAGDLLAPGAVATYRAAIADGRARIAYADDDLLRRSGRRLTPHFKPDWNSELFRHFDYLSGACILRADHGDLDVANAGDWMRQLVTNALSSGAPRHVRNMLHHRRERPAPVVPAAIARPEGELPPVTVIIPTRNRVDLLRTCLDGIAATDYPHIDVIVVDNDSDDPQTLAFLEQLDPRRHRVLRHAGPFNYSAINNRAVAQARGALLCLLNNDIEVIATDWLATMAVQAVRDNVGAVGARLLYPDGRIQHAGVVLGVGGGAAHAHRLLDPDEEGYFKRHALPQFVSAVTAACLVVARDRFLAVGGLDEKNFPVAFNDVDLCLRLNRAGHQSLYEPRATLIHHESVSRGWDRDPVGAARLATELAALKRIWNTDARVDPFHHPDLSPSSERFVVRL